MDQFKLLGVALGLACLAGVNLYLTVFVTGLAIHQHWIVLSPAYQSLAVLGSPLILWIAGALYVLEFFADKIPWIDSAWDTVHTIIRPIGGALLAIRVLGQTSPAFDIIVALAAGGASLVTHSAKASTRLVTNASPEPFSNIGLSLAEDAAVVGGLALIHFNPIIALAVCVLLLSIILYFAPKIFRAVRVKLWLIWKKLNGPADEDAAPDLPTALPSRYQSAFSRENLLGETLAWAVPCVAKRVRGVPSNSSGMLAAMNEDSARILFLARKGWRAKAATIRLEGATAIREPKFLSENLVIASDADKTGSLLIFERGRGPRVQQIVDYLNRRAAGPVPVTEPQDPVQA
ncbi:MAG: DUF4126 domain-containing protein [Chthoniobacterales bacterium]